MGFNTVEDKIKNLFAKRTKEGSGDGVRYDTYLFYFSGLTSEDGSLVLGGKNSVFATSQYCCFLICMNNFLYFVRGSGGEAPSAEQFFNKNNAFLCIFRPK